MRGREQQLSAILALASAGAMARSACGASLLQLLKPLLDAGVIVEERSGAGRRLVVRNPGALNEFIRTHFPQAGLDEGAGTRERGVATFRDSKALACDTPEILLARGWSDGVLSREGLHPGVTGATKEHGLFAFVLDHSYRLSGPVALVENPAVFLKFEALQLPEPLVLWSRGGHVSGVVLNWLASQAGDFSLLHLPDYDPVGLSEFSRLRTMLGARVHLHLPADLPERFARFSNRNILDKPGNRALLATMAGSALEEVRQVTRLIQQHNACLEQEALLVQAR